MLVSVSLFRSLLATDIMIEATCRTFMKLYIEDVYRMSSSKHEFRENRVIDSHKYEFRENRVIDSHKYEFHENRHSEDRMDAVTFHLPMRCEAV